jgi:hypothetical protein
MKNDRIQTIPQDQKPKKHGFWRFVGGAVVLAVAAGVLANIHDIKRYIKISTM